MPIQQLDLSLYDVHVLDGGFAGSGIVGAQSLAPSPVQSKHVLRPQQRPYSSFGCGKAI